MIVKFKGTTTLDTIGGLSSRLKDDLAPGEPDAMQADALGKAVWSTAIKGSGRSQKSVSVYGLAQEDFVNLATWLNKKNVGFVGYAVGGMTG